MSCELKRPPISKRPSVAKRRVVSKRTAAYLPAACVSLLLVVSGCGKAPPDAGDAALAHGRTVWEGTCRTCHLNGIGGAPAMGNKKAWAPRIGQGIDVLVAHAQQGFSGSEGSMPPRGGNESLSDSDIAAAVNYMVANSR